MFDLPLLILDMRAFEDAGVFEHPDEDRPFELPYMRGTMCYVPDNDILEFKDPLNCGNQPLEIFIAYADLRFGRRKYFICPWCGQPRLTLVIHEINAICKSCYKAEPNTMSKAKRDYLLKKAEEVIGIYRIKQQRARELENIDNKPVENSASPIGTEEGLKHGRGAAFHDIYIYYMECSPAKWRTFENEPFSHPTTTSLTTRHGVLDIRVLAREGMLVPHHAMTTTLVWPLGKTGDHTLLIVLDYRDEVPFLMVSHKGNEPSDPSWQRIDMVVGADRKPRFVCPATKGRVDMLYLRNGAFASATAQRLYHPSQRSAGFTPK